MAISTDYSVNSITVNSTTSSTTDNGYEMDMEDFFKILAAQLQNQSMYDTTDNAEYISQMAQFSMLSQMQEMASSIQSTQALSLMGKNVSLVNENTDGTYSNITGVVESVVFQNGSSYVGIDGIYYESSAVYLVNEATSTSAEE